MFEEVAPVNSVEVNLQRQAVDDDDDHYIQQMLDVECHPRLGAYSVPHKSLERERETVESNQDQDLKEEH
jgi:hypothetical protein